MRARSISLLLVSLCLLSAGGAAAEALVTKSAEHFDYRWTLGGFKGVIARLIIPGHGEGRLTTGLAAGDHLVTELRISSRQGRHDEYWLYGAEIDPVEKRTVKAWSVQQFRGETRHREREAGDIDALDLASSIYYLRKELPAEVQEAEIWSSGTLNPIIIEPTGRGSAEWRGRAVATRGYSIRGLSKPGRPVWRGQMGLILTDDAQAIPLEITVVRKGMRIRLELVETGDA